MGSDTASNFSGFSRKAQLKNKLQPASVLQRFEQTTKQWQIKEVDDSQMNSPFAARDSKTKLGWTSGMHRESKGLESSVSKANEFYTQGNSLTKQTHIRSESAMELDRSTKVDFKLRKLQLSSQRKLNE